MLIPRVRIFTCLGQDFRFYFPDGHPYTPCEVTGEPKLAVVKYFVSGLGQGIGNVFGNARKWCMNSCGPATPGCAGFVAAGDIVWITEIGKNRAAKIGCATRRKKSNDKTTHPLGPERSVPAPRRTFCPRVLPQRIRVSADRGGGHRPRQQHAGDSFEDSDLPADNPHARNFLAGDQRAHVEVRVNFRAGICGARALAGVLGRNYSELAKYDCPATLEGQERVIFTGRGDCRRTCQRSSRALNFSVIFHGLAAKRGFRRSGGAGAAVILELRVGDGIVSF
jgi:hypothetical protein